MIRFECTLCDVRFPTFHPDYTPPFTLDVLRHCSNEVAHWEDEKRPGPPTQFAETYRGRCKACELSLKKVEDDECLKGVAVFSARNQQLPWHGFPATDRLTTLQMTKQALFDSATVLESMLVALAHMQVSVCMFEGRGGSSRTGISRFRKNNICFPQRVSELQQHEGFMSKLEVNDIVNVPRLGAAPNNLFTDIVRARVVRIQEDGILVWNRRRV